MMNSPAKQMNRNSREDSWNFLYQADMSQEVKTVFGHKSMS